MSPTRARLSKAWFISELVMGTLLLNLYGLGIFVLLWSCVKYFTTEIAFTNRRFIFKTGLIGSRVNEVSLQKLEGVSLSQGIIGRMLGYGTAQIRGTGSDKVFLERRNRKI